MKRLAAASMLALAVSTSGVSGSQQPAPADACDTLAHAFSSDHGSDSDRADGPLSGMMVKDAHIDFDGDGQIEHMWIRNDGGTMHLAELHGELGHPIDFLDGTQRSKTIPNDPYESFRFAYGLGFWPFGKQWYLVAFDDDEARKPATAITVTKAGAMRFACVFNHTTTEMVRDYAAPDPRANGASCSALQKAPVVAPVTNDTISEADFEALKAVEPEIRKEKEDDNAGYFGVVVQNVYHIDIDNDGQPERLAGVEYRWGGGRTCTSKQFRLLPEKGGTKVDEAKRVALLKEQGLYRATTFDAAAGCDTQLRWRTANGMSAFELTAGDLGGSFTIQRGKDVVLSCNKAFDLKFSVAYREKPE